MVNGTPIKSISDTFRDQRDEWERGIANRYRFAIRDRNTRRPIHSTDGTSEDHAIDSESDYYYMVERARELDRDDPIAGTVVNRLCNSILQNGFMVKPKTQDAEVNAYLAMRFDDWGADPLECDVQQERTFNQLSWHALRDVVVAGDILAAKATNGAIQLWENHRLRTPYDLPGDTRDMTIYGVELDGARRRQAYWITEDDIPVNRIVRTTSAKRIPAFGENGQRNVLHLYHPKRTTQTRGVSKFVTVGNICAMLADVEYAKLLQQQMVSAFGLFRRRPMGFELPDDIVEATRYDQDPGAPGQLMPIKKVSPAMIYTGHPGEELVAFSANVPNPTYFDHTRQLTQLISINLDVPLMMVMLDASETNFSGYRGAMEQAKITFRLFQAWWCGEFHDPLYTWKIRQWLDPKSDVADQYLIAAERRGIDLFSRGWVFPTWVSVEPLKDTQERLLRYSNNMASLRRLHAEVNQDFETELDHLIEDRALTVVKAKRKAAEINSEFPDDPFPVNWMHLASHATPQGVSFSIPQEEPQSESAPTQAPARKANQ